MPVPFSLRVSQSPSTSCGWRGGCCPGPVATHEQKGQSDGLVQGRPGARPGHPPHPTPHPRQQLSALPWPHPSRPCGILQGGFASGRRCSGGGYTGSLSSPHWLAQCFCDRARMTAGKARRLTGGPTIHSSSVFTQTQSRSEARSGGCVTGYGWVGGQVWGKEASGGFRPQPLAIFVRYQAAMDPWPSAQASHPQL